MEADDHRILGSILKAPVYGDPKIGSDKRSLQPSMLGYIYIYTYMTYKLGTPPLLESGSTVRSKKLAHRCRGPEYGPRRVLMWNDGVEYALW